MPFAPIPFAPIPKASILVFVVALCVACSSAAGGNAATDAVPEAGGAGTSGQKTSCTGTDAGDDEGGDGGRTQDASADTSVDVFMAEDAATEGGGGGGVGCTSATPSFSSDLTPIFRASCSAEPCHVGWPYNQLVNVHAQLDMCAGAGLIVSPGSLAESYLMNKITGVGMCPGTARMPKGESPLPAADIQTIADWICEGAPNN
jgi:hypothetical protein